MSTIDLLDGLSVSWFSRDDISVGVRLLLLLPGRASSTEITSLPVPMTSFPAGGADGSL